MPTYDYDVLIIGSGPGGYVAGIKAGQLGLKAAVIEKDKLGGVCLNIGCIPSKAIIHYANLYRNRKPLESIGLTIDTSGLDYSKVFTASRKAADTLSKGVAFLLKKNNVAVVQGTAKMVTDHEVVVDDQKRISAQSIIIASGSRPREIRGFEFDEQMVLSSNGALMLQQLPKKVLILGAGAIGVEFAHIMNGFDVEVHLVEMMPQILPLEDHDVSEALKRSFTKRGITIYTSTKATALTKAAQTATVLLENEKHEQISLTVDKVLVVTGRRPNTDGIGLEQIGVATDRGYIPVGTFGETSVKGVYAIGDIVPTPMLAHVASKEAEIAVEHIAGHPPLRSTLDPMLVPGAVYCEPQVASFGLTEKAAIAQNRKFKKSQFPFRGAGKAVATGDTEGFVKLLSDTETNELIGAHIIGAEATELIHEVLLARTSELLPIDVAETIHAHPTFSETVMEAARGLIGLPIHI